MVFVCMVIVVMLNSAVLHPHIKMLLNGFAAFDKCMVSTVWRSCAGRYIGAARYMFWPTRMRVRTQVAGTISNESKTCV